MRNTRLRISDESHFPTHGFVKVYEPNEDGGYDVQKGFSLSKGIDNSNGIETLFSLYRTLHKDLISLESELVALRKSERSHHRWDLRYRKRTAIWSNIILGCWIFAVVFINTAKRHHRAQGKLIGLVKVNIDQTNSNFI